MNYGETPEQALTRELQEEAWWDNIKIGNQPKQVLIHQKNRKKIWLLQLFYEVETNDFRKETNTNKECQEIWFFSLEEISQLSTAGSVQSFVKKLYNEKYHLQSGRK